MDNSNIFFGNINLITFGINITTISFSNDGLKVVSGSEDNIVRIWDIITNSIILNLYGHTNVVSSTAFNYNGLKVVSGSWDNTVCIWDAIVGTVLLKLQFHTDWIFSVAFSNDGSKIVSRSYNKSLCICDTINYNFIGNIKMDTVEKNGLVMSLYYTKYGSLISCNNNGIVCIFNINLMLWIINNIKKTYNIPNNIIANILEIFGYYDKKFIETL